MRRRFNDTERLLLKLDAGNRCAHCGGLLGSSFHADHVKPFARGGETKLDNGQALCPRCNWAKGDRTLTKLPAWPESSPLRKWHHDCWTQLVAVRQKKRDFLCVACPGAGKTRFSVYTMHRMLNSGDVDQVIVVCPSEHLTYQWAIDAAQFGIHLDVKQDTELILTSDMHGIVVTYQSIAANPAAFERLCKRRKTLFVGDEIHHAGDQKSWGASLVQAFDFASFRLLLSGTPFRTDNCMIPFISYEYDGDGRRKSRADFTYGYGDALADIDVVRSIWFPTFDADGEWYRNGKEYRAKFGDDLGPREASDLLNTVLQSETWLTTVLQDANGKLTVVRESGHKNAGALVICKSKEHAEYVARLLRRMGEQPVVVTSDEKGASDLITGFANGSGRWLVAVKMVSEGVDIKRLRVGVYATNVLTEMYFRQVVGRFVRYDKSIPADDQSAYLYFPKVNQLYAYAQAIREERDHVIEAQITEQDFCAMNPPLDLDEPFLSRGADFFKPGEAEPIEGVVIGRDILIDPCLRPRAEEARTKLGICLPWEQIAAIMQFAAPSAPVQPAPAPAPPADSPAYKEKQKLRTLLNGLVNKLAFQKQRETGLPVEAKDIHAEYMRRGGKRQGEMTIAELREKAKWIESQLWEDEA